MKLRWILWLVGGIAAVAIGMYALSRPYLSGTLKGPPSLREFRGTYKSATPTEIIP